MIKNIVDTKTFLEIRTKDYPVGKKLRCVLWLEGMYEKEQIEEYIKSNLILNEHFKDIVIHDIKIFNTVLTNCRKEEEKYGELILISSITTFPSTKNDNENKKDKKVELSSLKLHNYSDKELNNLKDKINDEFIMREYKFSNDEYDFYKKNIEEVKLSEVKELFAKCDGDIFKLRKEKIRENLQNILAIKKVD